MKKTLLLLGLGVILSACSGANNDAGNRQPLSDIFKNAKDIVADFTQRDEKKELKDEDLAQWESLKADEERSNQLIGAEDAVTKEMLIGSYIAENQGYSGDEINKYLKFDLFVGNPYCENEFAAFEVVRVTDLFAMVKGCESVENSTCVNKGNERNFVIPKGVGSLVFDKQILTPAQNQCAIYAGTYKYSDEQGEHTVPVMTFEGKQIRLGTIAQIAESRLDVVDERNNTK